MKFEQIGHRKIYLDVMYFIAYAGGKRELPKKDQDEYNKIMRLPFSPLQRQELAKIPLEKNPNVVPLIGRDLIAFIRELKFVPFFDTKFEQTRLLKLTDLVIFESMKQKSYEAALEV